MNKKINLRERWQGLTDTVMRFPLTVILLIAAVVNNLIAIESDDQLVYTKLLVTFLLGAAIFVVLQLLYEHFLENPIFRIIFMVVTVISSILYYLLIYRSDWSIEVTIRTIVILFILVIAFLWIPTIHSKISINESFMAAFKGTFTALFFDAVLFLGTVIILAATNLLIFEISGEAYIHSANIIFILIAPIYLLTMIPYYPSRGEERGSASETGMESSKGEEPSRMASEVNPKDEELSRMTAPTKFLETLISYVIIPITAVFTIILLLYIVINISGEFWSDNLMEPLLVSYSVTVIVVYILTCTVQKPMAKYFRLIFPKVLIPVVLFQTLSSILKISDVGVTYGRYYVILFGVFATVAGVLFSILPPRKNSIIAPILIILSIISILPPVDAFTVSKRNQANRLENALIRNNMISDGSIVANASISKEDKEEIISSLNYLDRMNYAKNIDYLSAYLTSNNFERTFGFARYDDMYRDYKSYYYNRDTYEPISISGYDAMLQMNFYHAPETPDNRFEVNGSQYTLRVDATDEDNQIILLLNPQGMEMIRFEYNNLFTKFSATDNEKGLLPTEELTFRKENDQAGIAIIANNISLNEWAEGQEKTAELIVLIDIK